MAARTVSIRDARTDRELQVELLDDGQVRVGDRVYQVRYDGDGVVRITSETVKTAWIANAGAVRWVHIDGVVYELVQASASDAPKRRGGAHHGLLAAPMPATVRRVLVGTGDRVTPGQSLIILEAMKMELPVRAGASGTIRAIHCREGELVQPGVTLIDLDPDPA
jgi:3-methylcrotonyl-CoA carboxylase alpha subunit